MAQHLGKSEFQSKVIEASKPVLVDFFASWCGPCQAMAPVIDELAGEFKGKAEVFKVDIEKEGDLANEYSVQSIPTLFVFKGGKVAKQFNGVTSKKELTEALSE